VNWSEHLFSSSDVVSALGIESSLTKPSLRLYSHSKKSGPSFSIIDSDVKETAFSCMSRAALEFVLFQSLTKVLLDMKHDSYAFEEMFLR
jgi:hypothetical protein